MKKSWILLVLVFAAACSGKSDPAAAPAASSGENIKQVVEDFSSAKRTAKSVSAKTSELLVVENDGTQKTYPMPKNEFYLSIAPFVEHTHTCYNHNLTSCKGEMVNKTVHVNVKDASGKVLIDKDVQTFQNGFLDLWVPRGEKVKVKVDYDGKSSEEELPTNENDRTCITTMKLS
ncbi:MAG: hypothetical protein K0Q90_3730 [Paenibacillaceae bacterium]|nr:hypothetical protein [Paenibacillaceae bacterium]